MGMRWDMGWRVVVREEAKQMTKSSSPAKKWIQSAHLQKYRTESQGLEASKFPSRHFPILMDSQPLDYRVLLAFSWGITSV